MNQNPDILQVTVGLEERLHELFIAEFVEDGFEAFEQVEDVLRGYLPATSWSDNLRTRLVDWLVAHGVDPQVESLVIPSRNWNEVWERSIQPVFVPPFVIKPSWIPLESGGNRIVIEIDPKMSFGTGYHESTRLALRLLPDAIKPGDRVLDAGTGTGVLAIAAIKFGASTVLAFDNDPWSQENAVENIERNGVSESIRVELGTLEDVPIVQYDVILANIQLSIIREMMEGFVERLADGGRIVVSGLLESHRDAVHNLAAQHGLELERDAFEGEWFAAELG